MVKAKKTKKRNFNTKKRVIIILLTILIFVVGTLIGLNYFFKNSSNYDEIEKQQDKEEQKESNEYNYKLSNNASEYEKKLFVDLESILNQDIIDDEKYVLALSKLFVADLFTLNSKKSSSDVTSVQYVYSNYQETYKKLVKDTIYSNIELNLDGKRTQKLPIVKDVVVSNIERKSFSLNNEVLDSEAFEVTLDIVYEENLEYPTKYTLVLVKNNKKLEVVKSF